ncbi:MAG TPA: hypothetical protein VHS33_09790 [Sphingomicrobium sp.]|jgi:hypothetical protein|nr:hypothetical protein [Sphingomicrobium sp.]
MIGIGTPTSHSNTERIRISSSLFFAAISIQSAIGSRETGESCDFWFGAAVLEKEPGKNWRTLISL